MNTMTETTPSSQNANVPPSEGTKTTLPAQKGGIFNLKPNTTLSTERAKEIGRLGGLSKSPLKSIAQKLRAMKQYGKITDEMHAKLHDMMIDPEASSFENLKYIIALAGQSQTPKDKKDAASLLLDWHKLHHGSKEKIQIDQKVDITKREVKIEIISNPQDEIKKVEDGLVVQKSDERRDKVDSNT